MVSYINEQMPILCHQPNIYQRLKENILNKFNVAIIKCPNREISFQNKCVMHTVKMMVNHWCTTVNRILFGKYKINNSDEDPIKIKARKWYLKISRKQPR